MCLRLFEYSSFFLRPPGQISHQGAYSVEQTGRISFPFSGGISRNGNLRYFLSTPLAGFPRTVWRPIRELSPLLCFFPSDARRAPVVTGGHATHADSAGDHAHPTAACPRPSPAAERSRSGERARRGGVEATTEACRDGRLCHRWHGWVFPLLGWDCFVLCVGGGEGGAGGWWLNVN